MIEASQQAVPAAVISRMRGAHRILAVSHENPDADTLGATIGIGLIAERLGATADLVCTDRPPAVYDYLPWIERFRLDPDPNVTYDLLVVSDCATLERVGAVGVRHAELLKSLARVVVDHHVSNDATGEADWIDPAAAATCEMVALLAEELGVGLDTHDGALATALISGIVMDTATFAHPNTTPRTLSVAARLVAAGAPLSDVSRRLYRSKPAPQLRLFGVVLARLREAAAGRVVWSILEATDLATEGVRPEYSEGIIDLLSQAEPAEVTILFKEAGTGTRLSVRTKPGGVDATVLTGLFGGGGHARAAGASLDSPLAEAVPTVLAEAERLAAAVVR